jgi:hypothetical protein
MVIDFQVDKMEMIASDIANQTKELVYRIERLKEDIEDILLEIDEPEPIKREPNIFPHTRNTKEDNALIRCRGDPKLSAPKNRLSKKLL